VEPDKTPSVETSDETTGPRLPFARKKLSEDQFESKFSAAFARHWAQVRADRQPGETAAEAVSIHPGTSNFSRAQVPYGVDLAAAWSWRFVVIVAAGFLVTKAIGFLSLVVLPLVIALFLAALLVPVVDLLDRRLDRGVSAGLVVIGLIGFLTLMLTFATQQVVDGATDLANQVVGGLDEIRAWLETGPLNASDAQINDGIRQMQDLITTSNNELVGRLQDVGTAVGHIVAGFFIVLFATFFFMSDGQRIWSWIVRLFPRAARERADASGRIAWTSLTQFVRATVLVALVDAAGIMLVAAILDVPFVLAIGVLVFLGGFIPLVGAAISGSVAVLVALVDQGPIVALIMLGGVIAVQQLEAHVLQPFLLGRMVSVHPLAVIVAIASGAYLAGIAGALVAVPLVASLNAVAVYLSTEPDVPEEIEEDVTAETGEGVTPDPKPSPGP
jgi:predicted PurR-regulated permease PerM